MARYSLDSEGSPPQVRGKLCGMGSVVPQHGITPAGAGKTGTSPSGCTRRTDHPRRCGENCSDTKIDKFGVGSPPQVRGKLAIRSLNRLSPRITPAGAGKTQYKPSRQGLAQDHPRRCGENLAPLNTKCAVMGSPPQVRGKPIWKAASGRGIGITPAGAGKTTMQ